MRRLGGGVHILWAAFAVLSCLATLHASRGASTARWSRFAPVTATTPFRLGTAGRPFAWSTAVGDLNGDGTLDYAVADRIGRDQAGFQYAVELSITGGQAHHVTFSSPEAALSIALRDVDHDQDLDVVVSPLVSPGVVRVWLNDGAGAFAETSGFDTSLWLASASLLTDSDANTTIDVVSTSRRGRDALGSAGQPSTADTGAWVLSAVPDACPLSPLDRTSRSRAPPSAAFPIL